MPTCALHAFCIYRDALHRRNRAPILLAVICDHFSKTTIRYRLDCSRIPELGPTFRCQPVPKMCFPMPTFPRKSTTIAQTHHAVGVGLVAPLALASDTLYVKNPATKQLHVNLRQRNRSSHECSPRGRLTVAVTHGALLSRKCHVQLMKRQSCPRNYSFLGFLNAAFELTLCDYRSGFELAE